MNIEANGQTRDYMSDRATPDSFVEISAGSGKPGISVLMPIYEQARFIAKSVSSIILQQNIVAEIIISDDGSQDGTYDHAHGEVVRLIALGQIPHRILMRRGTVRLHADHLPLLIDSATCDVVTQAHGDDISHPNRLSIVTKLFADNPHTTMVASNFDVFRDDEYSSKAWPSAPTPIPTCQYAVEAIVSGFDRTLIGCTQAWRRSAVAGFGRLDMSVATTSHDRILSFRAYLQGSVHQIQFELVRRRVHANAWSRRMVGKSSTDAQFSWQLIRFNYHRKMLADLEIAVRAGMIPQDEEDSCRTLLGHILELDVTNVLSLFDAQVRSFKRISWISE